MTYCLGIQTHQGLVMASDSRTNAGYDQINTCRKMYTFVQPGERAPHTTTSCAPATSRRNCGVEITPSRCAETAAHSTPVAWTAAAQAQIRQSGSSAAASRSSLSVRANAARPAVVLGVRYNDHDGLVALGIDVDLCCVPVDDLAWRQSATPFPGSDRRYAAPPAGWQEGCCVRY